MRHAAHRLLEWYDRHARVLPWRGSRDPYRVWLSEVMLQQTTVASVGPRYAAWVERWPSVEALAGAGEADVLGAWAGLGYYARARNLHAAARAVVARGGFPGDAAGWRALPGVGDYTAAAVAAIAYGEVCVPVDANIARVGARLFAADLSPGALRARLAPMFAVRAGDVAQALMDLGSGLCGVRAAECGRCPLRGDCAGAASGEPTRWPARKVKAARPVRRGLAFWLEAERHVLIVRRPPRGLLGGMAALPVSAWGDGGDALADAPVKADWRVLDERVAHVFTHFHLDLGIARAELRGRVELAGEWVAVGELARAGLPTLFAKAAKIAGANARSDFEMRDQ